MILIGENIHIISKKIREALINFDEDFLKGLIKIQKNLDYADLNVGPAKSQMKGVLCRLAKLVESNSDLGISFDTTNSEEIKEDRKSVV